MQKKHDTIYKEGYVIMQTLEKLIVSLGGTKVNKIKNTITPSILYRFENNLYITIEYDKRDQYKSVELGRLFLMRDFFPRLIVLEDFELLLKAANSIRLPVTYKFNYSMLSYREMIENIICNLKIVLENYKQLYLISKTEFEKKEKRLEKYLIKDVSLLSIQEIEKESSKIIYKPKINEIKYSKLTHKEKKLKEESDNFRAKYNIPNNIYTKFEYNKLKEKKENYKVKLICSIIIEIITVFIFIFGLINNNWFTGNDFIYFLFIVVTLAALGLCLVASISIKKISYFISPILCFFLPFVFMDKIVGTNNDILLFLITIMAGTILFVFGLIFEVIIPLKKQRKATVEYENKFTKQYSYKAYMIREYQPLCLYLESGRYVSIITLQEEYYVITVRGFVFYNKIRTSEVPIEHIEVSCNYSQAIDKAIKLLQKNDQIFIFKN